MNTKIYPEDIKKQGWEQMNTILEKEMPRKNNRVRLIFLFLLVGILSTSGIVLTNKYQINKSDNSTPQQQKIENNKPIQNNEPIASGQIDDTEKPLKPDNYQKNTLERKLRKSHEGEYINERELIKINNTPEQLVKNQVENSEKQNSGQVTEITKYQKDFNIISKIHGISNKGIIFQKDDYLLPAKTVLSYQKPINRFWHPFVETKLFNKSIDKADPGVEFCIGNTFLLSSKMFIDLVAGYADPGLFGNSVLFLQADKAEGSSSLNLGNTGNKIINTLSGGLVELSVFQGYRINRKLSIRGGGGIVFTKLLSSRILNENNVAEGLDASVEFKDDKNNSYSFSQNGLTPGYGFFAEANVKYKIYKGLSVIGGYKHYFREYNVVTDNGKEDIYRVYFQQPHSISDFYLGLRYNFEK